MAPRGGVLAARLIKGLQLAFPPGAPTYRPRVRMPAVFDVCDPDGLRPGWTESVTTVAARPVLDALDFGSQHYEWGGRMWLPTFFAVWEDDYRHRLAAAHQCKPRDFQIPFFGDLRKLRNDVTHRRGVARADGAASCEVLRWFSVDEPITLNYKHFREVVEKFPWTELAVPPPTVDPGKANLSTHIDDDLALRFRQAALKSGMKLGEAVEAAIQMWMTQQPVNRHQDYGSEDS